MSILRKKGTLLLIVAAVTAVPVVAYARALQADGDLPAVGLLKGRGTVLFEADPWSLSTELREITLPPRAAPRPLDARDPWLADSAPSSVARVAPPSLDARDPWGREPAPPEGVRPITTSKDPAATPGQSADDALRQAIKAAVDAGDLDRAAKLLEILRATKH